MYMVKDVIDRIARMNKGEWLLLDYWAFAINSEMRKNGTMSHKEVAKKLKVKGFKRKIVNINGGKNILYIWEGTR